MEKENKVITKEDECKALEQIKKIVENVGGEESYIGMAFKGVFELAEQNIENDFYCSALDWKNERDRLKNEAIEDNERIEWLKKKVKEKETLYDNLYARFREQENRAIKAEKALLVGIERVKPLAEEIIKLKAKLYDLTVKE